MAKRQQGCVLFPLEHTFTLGRHYDRDITINKRDPEDPSEFAAIQKKRLKHKECFRQHELEMLLNKAQLFTHARNSQEPNSEVKFAYRNNTAQYFDDIFATEDKIMKVYTKDNNGDPGCPTNGQISGLFFAVQPDYKYSDPNILPDISPFGDTRVIVPIEKLIEPDVRLYFSDFYCFNDKYHYVSLVAAKPNTPADTFCQENLIKLPEDNPFFFKVDEGFFCVKEMPRVEIFYTENINLNAEYIELDDEIYTVGRGLSTPGGLPKRSHCTTCNI